MDIMSRSQGGELIERCPLRLLLADELIRCSTQLAFAEGDRLNGCSDLVRVPSKKVWVEWLEAPRREVLHAIAGIQTMAETETRRAGAYFDAEGDGRSGTVRSFWSTRADELQAAPLLAEFDLDTDIRSLAENGEAGYVGVSLPEEPAIDAMLAHFRFRPAQRPSVATNPEKVREALGSSAFDLPMLFATFLLMTAKEGTDREMISMQRANRARLLTGKTLLLDHIEVRARIGSQTTRSTESSGSGLQRRLHHVRGHLARRGHTVYWRSPHLRGSARLGVIKSRTVALSF